MSAKWFALYTKPRWEKKVNNLLLQKGIETYCPLNKVRRKWSDRVKLVEDPLFKSYVFVRITDADRSEVRITDGVVNFVHWDGKPAVIKDKEIQVIKQFLEEHENVEVIKIDLELNQRVTITEGPMLNMEGKVVQIKHKVAKVAIDSLGCMLIADIEKGKLAPAQTKKNKN